MARGVHVACGLTIGGELELVPRRITREGLVFANGNGTEVVSRALAKMKTAHSRLQKLGQSAPKGRERDEVRRIAADLARRFHNTRNILRERYDLGEDD